MMMRWSKMISVHCTISINLIPLSDTLTKHKNYVNKHLKFSLESKKCCLQMSSRQIWTTQSNLIEFDLRKYLLLCIWKFLPPKLGDPFLKKGCPGYLLFGLFGQNQLWKTDKAFNPDNFWGHSLIPDRMMNIWTFS